MGQFNLTIFKINLLFPNILPARIGTGSRNHPLEGEVSVDINSVAALSGAGSGLSPHSVTGSTVFVSIGVNGRSNVDVDSLEKISVGRISHKLKNFYVFD